MEDLGDHRRLVGFGYELHSLLAGVTTVTLRERLALAPIAVGRSTSHAPASLDPLALPAPGFPGELVALELVP